MNNNERAKTLVAEMTLEEKASLCSGDRFWHLKGIERLGLKPIMVTDGPHGLRKQAGGEDQLGINESVPATCFPAACLTACSFDRELLYEIGVAIGEECRQEDVSVVLGPGVNMKRSPLCGRNFEYFSEDPLLAGELAAGFIQGVQSQNVGTSLKHFAANNQEKLRMTVEAVVDERALREIYLTAFEIAVKKAQPWTVMCSYNKLGGQYASENRRLLTDILRGEWGFRGLVVSDWGATNDRVVAVHAGMDLEMPSITDAHDIAVAQAVRNGGLPESELDTDAERVTELILKSETRKPLRCDMTKHHALAKRAAASSAVLLKNEESILPLKAGKTIAVIGALAKNPRYQGSGSSRINPHRVDIATDELRKAGFVLSYAEGYELSDDSSDEALILEACKQARGKDIVVLFMGLPDRFESEGFDRESLGLPDNQIQLLERVAAVNPNIVVVLQTGGVVDCAWESNAKAILLQYLGGEASCGATVDLLTGKCCPSGKLAESWCKRLSDNPSYRQFPGWTHSVEYQESIYIGYRYYDTAKKEVRWPFGYGLSYTSFAYSDMQLDRSTMTDEDELTVSLNVKNTGACSGSEIVELYVAPPVGIIFRPVQELKGFEKVTLAPGETKRVEFRLSRRAFTFYDVNSHDWAVESGEYEIRIAASSRDMRLRATVEIASKTSVAIPDYRKTAPCYYDLSDGLVVPKQAFIALLGHDLPQRERQKKDPYTVNSTIAEIQDSFFGRILAKRISTEARKVSGDDPGMLDMVDAMVNDAPLRMLLMINAYITPKRLEGIVDILNGKLLRGIKDIRSQR